MSASPPDSPKGRAERVDRREFMRRVGVGATVAVGVTAASTRTPISPVGDAKAVRAFPPNDSAAVVGWLVRAVTPSGSDAPPDGLTKSTLRDQTYDTINARNSVNERSYTRTSNVLDGAENVAYSEGKIAAIEELNDQKPKEDVEDAATTAVDDHFATIEKNFLEGWKENALEFETIVKRYDDHDDVSLGDDLLYYDDVEVRDGDDLDTEYELANGDTYEIPYIYGENSGDSDYWNPIDKDIGTSHDTPRIEYDNGSGELSHLHFGPWGDAWNDIQDLRGDVKDGIIMWVDEVHDEVQAGELDTDELLTPREFAQMSTEEEGVRQAVADLQALNMSSTKDREATIYLEDTGATLKGTLYASEDMGFESGDDFDPDDEDAIFWFVHDLSEGSGEWDAYDDSKGVDGGEIHFDEEPYDEILYEIETAEGETAEVIRDDFVALDADDEELDNLDDPDAETWEVNVSDQLDDAVTDIDEVTFSPDVDDTEYDTFEIDEQFTIEKIEDSDGEEVDSMETTSNEPEENDNYITEEEWKDREEAWEEEVDKYEESQEGGGGAFPGAGEAADLLDEFGQFAAIALAGLAALFFFGGSN